MKSLADHKLFLKFADEAWNKGNLDVVYEVFEEEYIAHAQDPSHSVRGSKGHADIIAGFREAFPDVHIELNQIFTEDELLVAHMTWSGTQMGVYMDMEPTNRKVEVTVIGINRFENGKVVEAWGVVDTLTMLQQLGVIPSEDRPENDNFAFHGRPADTPEERLSLEENKTIVRRYVEQVWNNNQIDLIPELFADDYAIHTMGMTMKAPHTMLQQGIQMAHNTFPDFHMEIGHMVACQDRVMAHWTNTGTHLGEFLRPGMEQGIPASGKKVEFDEIAIFRIAGSQIAEGWYVADQLTMLQQIGLASSEDET